MTELSESQMKELDAIVAKLSHEDSDVRRWAIYDLEQFSPEHTVEHLVRGTEDEHRAVREAAAEVLNTVPADQCLRLLIPLLGSPRIEVRNLVAAIVAKFDAAAVDYLLEALDHGNEDVRKFSADILGLTRSDQAVEGLAKALYDTVENVGVSAAEALGKIRSVKAMPHLVKAFQDRDYLKRECAEALGLLGIPEAAHFLMEKFLATDELLVKYAMIDAMGNAGDLKVLAFMEQNFDRIEEMLHGAVALGVMKIARREHINVFNRPGIPLQAIVESTADSDEEYQQLLIGHIDASVKPDVLQVLTEGRAAFNSNALVALIKAAAPHTELGQFLLDMVDHSDDWVAYTALEHLTHLDKASAANVIKRVLGGTRNLPQLAAIKVAQRIELTEAREWIKPFLKSEDEDLRGMAEQVLGA